MSDYKFFFATDIHGSDLCLKKFLNSGKFYGVDAIIMGGDITGKMIVPIVAGEGGSLTRPILSSKRELFAHSHDPSSGVPRLL